MSLLEKFGAVEIKADNRIAEEDKAFCQREQEAFDKSGPALQQIADLMQSSYEEQKSILGIEDGNNSFYNPYMTSEHFRCDVINVHRAMMERNEHFICRIVSYFSRKYKVELDDQKIKEHLIPAAPKEPSEPYYVRQHFTDEELDAYRAKVDAYKKGLAEFNQRLRALPLRYEQVVDEIFVQLGGFSFQERAMNEMLARCWKASHREDWRTNKTVEEFEVKNATLKLLESGYWCRCKDDSWRSYEEWEPGQGLKTVLEAVAHFQCGRMNEGHLWFPELFKYDTRENVFDIRNMEKVKGIKMFKNGRVDIKFSSAAFAQEFVENYLRRYVEVNAA